MRILWECFGLLQLSFHCPFYVHISLHFKQRCIISLALLWFCVSLLNKCSSFNFSYLLLVRFSIHITSNFKQCTNVPSKFFLYNGIHKRFTGSLSLNHLLHVDPPLVLLPFVKVACFSLVRSETARTGCPKIVSPSTKSTVIFAFLRQSTTADTPDIYKLLSRIVLQQRFITFRVKAISADKWLRLTGTLWYGNSHIVLIIITRSKSHIQTQSEMYSFGWNMSKWRPGKFRKYCHLAFLTVSFNDADKC